MGQAPHGGGVGQRSVALTRQPAGDIAAFLKPWILRIVLDAGIEMSPDANE